MSTPLGAKKFCSGLTKTKDTKGGGGMADLSGPKVRGQKMPKVSKRGNKKKKEKIAYPRGPLVRKVSSLGQKKQDIPFKGMFSRLCPEPQP